MLKKPGRLDTFEQTARYTVDVACRHDATCMDAVEVRQPIERPTWRSQINGNQLFLSKDQQRVRLIITFKYTMLTSTLNYWV